jgi:hypothetical protein
MKSELFADLIKPVTAWMQAQTNGGDHLRPLLTAGAVIAVLIVLFGANSFLNDQTRDLRRVQSDLSNLSRQLSEGSWEDRRRQSDALRLALSERFWQAETAGLAEATLERWLRDRSEKYGVKPDTIRIQRSAVGSGTDDKVSLKGVQRMTAKVTMPFQPQAVVQILDEVARNDKIMIVDRLFIRSGRNPLVEIDFSTFIRLDEPVRQP